MKVFFIDYCTVPKSQVQFFQTVEVGETKVTTPRIGERIAGFRDDGVNQPVFRVVDIIYMMPENRIRVYLDFEKYV